MAPFADGAPDRLLDGRPILRVYAVQKEIEGYLRVRIEAEYAIALRTEKQVACRNIARPASRVAESLALRQIRLAAPQRVFGLLALADVPIDRVNLRIAAIHRNRRGQQFDVQKRAVLAPPDDLGADTFATVDRRSQLQGLPPELVRHDQVGEVPAHRFLKRVTEQRGEFPIGSQHPIVAITQDNRFRSQFEQPLKLRPLFAHHLFGTLAFGDVHAGADRLDQFTGFVHHCVPGALHAAHGSVGGHDAEFLLKITAVPNRSTDDLSEVRAVVRVNSFPEQFPRRLLLTGGEPEDPDRKSTRLNSSHLGISYAVF